MNEWRRGLLSSPFLPSHSYSVIDTCRIITVSPAEAWAVNVWACLHDPGIPPSTCDNWEEFCALFITSCGIPTNVKSLQ